MTAWLKLFGLWSMLVVSVLGIAYSMYLVSYFSNAPVGFALLAAVLFFVSSAVCVGAIASSWFTPKVHQIFMRATLLAFSAFCLGVLITVLTTVQAILIAP